MMSTQGSRSSNNDSITVNGVTFRRTNSTHVYRVNQAIVDPSGALVDGGANGGLLGLSDARVLETDLIATADVIGVTADILPSLSIVQGATKLETVHDGPIIGILSSYALRNDGGRTIHSKGQLESFGIVVDDKSASVGGSQCLITNEGYVVPIHIRDGLPYIDMSVPTDGDMASYPHVFLCSDSPWDPTILDGEFQADSFETPSVATERRDNQDPRVSDLGRVHQTHFSALLHERGNSPLPIYTDPTLAHANHVDSIVNSFCIAARSVFSVCVAALSAFPQQLRP